MLVRSSSSRASKPTRHTWMALMMDECATMAPLHIAVFVQRTFEDSCRVPAKGSAGQTASIANSDTQSSVVAHWSSSCASSSPRTVSASPSGSIAGSPAAKARAWAAVARLLCESGDWVRAAAVVDGLPLSVQWTTRHKAARDEWPLPPSVREAWGRAPDALAVNQTAANQATAATPLSSTPAKTAAGPVQSFASQPCEALAACRTAELVRVAYSLSRPRAIDAASTLLADTPAASLPGLKSEQQALVAELRRRGAVLEVVQCVVNWQRRHLALTDAEEATTTTATSADTRAGTFDGLRAVKEVLFPFAPTRGGGAHQLSGAARAVDSAFERRSSERSGRPPLYALAHLQVIRQVAASHPIILARCLCDRTVVDRLLCHAGEGVVAEVALLLMKRIAGVGSDGADRGPPVQAPLGEGEGVGAQFTKESAASTRWPRPHAANPNVSAAAGPALLLSQAASKPAPCEDVAAAATCWRALAALLFPLHPYIHAQSKTGKEKFLSALLAALDETKHMIAADRVHSRPTSSAAGCGVSVSLPAQGGTRVHRGCRMPVVLSDKARYAIKAAVESVCSPLLSHEPQVRFIRLHMFGQLAKALGDLGVPVPNALAQCLFLCMADTVGPPLSLGASDASSDSVTTYLSCAPSVRWLHALAMLEAAHRASAYRISAAHERAILSGLQSISITRTWTSALRTVAAFEMRYQLMPDERTLPTLLLNFKQQSWQDAFRVLRYVPGGEADHASPSILRDLQLVALKHASWVVPLRLMTHLQHRQADGFMNYLYCLCAAARSGRTELALHFFRSLRHGRGRHSASLSLSPYNELTVAVAAVAMLDYDQAEALVSFSARVAAMRAAGDTAAVAVEAAAEPGSPLLTVDGRRMTQAAHACALLALHRHCDLASFLQECTATSLPAVLRRVVVLHCLLGLGHLHAPVRLVFDVIGYQGSMLPANAVPRPPGADQSPEKVFLTAVAADQQRDGTFETRQRGTAERRQRLYIPVAHQRRQKKALATAWGRFMRDQEAALPPHVTHLVAESMVEEGVGAEYLTAALL
ncbi:conserved hypothetical protein [Leishmania major strain Friedlin]|uniref:Uncharacterized protein n=1 Tax=Leishmania major TaxID=5664 RepID=Q4QEZ3_LEIMA|nr:conserved hypothetical protein [Leishmania major strain Friedlin]CAG9572061.1 hypothetical_protein_-_conserved [Leishmania major strain Friedlin]CAJ03463.1 conserved hypothetical protein [Leishmania major strain Friedlin]|eukprot:XP_001682105.1 conserved hypothetical protein [Leishmania major strain Friedlin]